MSYIPGLDMESYEELRQVSHLPSPEFHPTDPGMNYNADSAMSGSKPDDLMPMPEPPNFPDFPLPNGTLDWMNESPISRSNLPETPTFDAIRYLSPNSDSAINQAPNGAMDNIENTQFFMNRMPTDPYPHTMLTSTENQHSLPPRSILGTDENVLYTMRHLTPMSEAESVDRPSVQTVSPLLLSANSPMSNPAGQTVSRKRVINRSSKKSPTTGRVQKPRSKTAHLDPYNVRDEYRAPPVTLSCDHCTITCSDKVTLGKHIRTEHTRPFQCIFYFAGCAEAFASKNEFKRHASVQHACPTYYHCTIGACANTKAPVSGHRHAHLPPYGKIFTRKDLYDQHQRRLHFGPEGLSAEDCHKREQQLAGSSLRHRCQLPMLLKCPFDGCNEKFEGEQTWDRMLEHVARHMELSEKGEEMPMCFSPEDETSLTSWASSEEVKIIKRNGDGWGFCFSKQAKKARKSKRV